MFINKRKCFLGLTLIAFTWISIRYFFSSNVFQTAANLALPTSRGLLTDTAVCQIPDMDPFDDSIQHAVKLTGRMECRGRPSVTYVDGSFLRVNRTRVEKEWDGQFSHCRHQSITRNNGSDFHFTYGPLGPAFTTDVEPDAEFVRVYCYDRLQRVLSVAFHGLFLPKAEVERRCARDLMTHTQGHRPREVLSVLVLGTDSVSRLNMARHMPHTRRFLLEELGAVEMLGYNKVADNTFPNLVPILTGRFAEELPWNERMVNQLFDDFPFVWKNFSRAGYRTLFAEDTPDINIFTYQKGGFRHPPTDYYLRPLFMAMEMDRKVWNNNHHCVNDVMETEVTLGHVMQFMHRFRDKPRFGFAMATRLTHDEVNNAGFADLPYLTFFRRFKDEGGFDNTVLVYFSDHGMRWGDIRKTEQGSAEDRLPFLFLAFPSWFKERYPALIRNVRLNARRLTTPFDLHHTLKDLLYFDGKVRVADLSQRGISLFREIPKARTCAQAGIVPHWCMCLEGMSVPLTGEIRYKAAQELVRHINRFLRYDQHLCAPLTLKTVHRGQQLGLHDIMRYDENVNDVIDLPVTLGDARRRVVFYQLMVETLPGNAMLEGTLRHDRLRDTFVMAGDVSRTNWYGPEAECLHNFRLKKFCFCRNLLSLRGPRPRRN